MSSDEQQQQQPLRLASLERVSSYSAVSSWWNAVTNYYSSAKNSENQTLASSVVLVERLTTPALHFAARVPSYCPEGMVETVDGVAVRQIEAAEQLVARGTARVSDSTTYVLSTKDAAVARGTEFYTNSTTYVRSSTNAVVSQVSESTASAVSTVVNEGSNYVVATREYAASSLEGSKKVLEASIAPCTSRVEGWRNALRQQFTAEKKQASDVAAPQEEGEKTTPFQRVAAVFPGIVRFDGDVIARPLMNGLDGLKQRREYVRQMFQQYRQTGESHLQATRDYIQPAVSQPTQTIASLKETSRSYATRALTSQRTLLETLRNSVTSLEKTRGTNPDSQLLRQLDYVPSFVFTWTTKSIDFSDSLLAWTTTYVSLPKEEESVPVVDAPVVSE